MISDAVLISKVFDNGVLYNCSYIGFDSRTIIDIDL